MQYKVIDLAAINPRTKCIDLPNDGELEVDVKKEECQITWKIATSEIKSFRLRWRWGFHPFVEKELPKDFKTELTLTLKKRAYRHTWIYSIEWIDNDKGKRHSDPKISINPHGFDPFLFFKALFSLLFGFLSLRFLFKKLNR